MRKSRIAGPAPEQSQDASIVGSAPFIVFVVGLVAVNAALLLLFLNGTIPSMTAFHVFNLYMLVFVVLFIVKSPQSVAYHLRHARRPVKKIAVGSAGGLLALLAALGARYLSSLFTGKPPVLSFQLTIINLLAVLYYFASVVIQEIITRSFCQNTLVRLLGRITYRKQIAILIVALIFAFSHIIHGPYVAACIFIFALLLGGLYDRTRSLIMVVLIHFFAGLGFFLLT
jgi:membrane protease YdiL (CAAX protease family)